MSTMVEKVAQAIEQSFGRYFVRKNTSVGWGELWEVVFALDPANEINLQVISSFPRNDEAEDCCEEFNRLYLGRAAIQAMLEPTEYMLNGSDAGLPIKTIWQNMIKRALLDG